MPKQPRPSPEEAVTAALNEQGFLFAQIIREKVLHRLPHETDPQSGWRLVASEYPVTAGDGSQTRIDHVLCSGEFHLTVECKRAHPDYKRWVMFDKADSTTVGGGALFVESFSLTQRPIRSPVDVSHTVRQFAMPSPCQAFNYYVETAIDREQKASSTKTIEEALQQVMRGHSGMMAKLVSFNSGFRLRSVPVIVTTAELLEARFDPAKVALRDGCISPVDVTLTPLEFCAVNCHADDKLSVKSEFAFNTHSSIESDLMFWQMRTVFVVHAQAINKFLHWANAKLTTAV